MSMARWVPFDGVLTAAGGLLLCAIAPAADAVPLFLTRDGEPAAAIVLAEKPTKAAQFAAFELQWHVKGISGAALPILRDPDAAPAGHVKLFVGDGAWVRPLGLSQDALALQEYAVRSGPGQIVFVGKDAADTAVVTYALGSLNDPAKNANWPGFWEERGTLHAVYDLLRDACGVRWFNPTDTGTLIPQQRTLTVEATNVRRTPTFRSRDAGIGNAEEYDGCVSLWSSSRGQGPKTEALRAWAAAAYADSRGRQGESWLVRRLQATLFLLRMRNGGELCRANHSLYHYYELFWAPGANAENAKYFMAKRPELFAQGYEQDPPPQMCYTNRALVAQVVQEARDYFDKGGYPYKSVLSNAPLGYKWGERYFCVEPMDNASFCKCPSCQVLVDKGKDHGAGKYFSQGIHSDYMFSFVNEVARDVKATHPDRNIVTLAYGTHAWLPKEIRLDPYVAVQFCFSTDSWPWYRTEYEHETRLVEEWAAEARASGRPLYAWCYLGHLARCFAYYGQFNGFPGLLAHAIDREFKSYRRLGYRGMFHCGLPMEVDTYVMFRLMDNADLSVDALLDEYFTGLYGAAAAPLKRFYLDVETVFCDPASRQDQVPNGGNAQEVDWEYLGTEARMAGYAKLMAEARALPATEREKRNVALFDLGVWTYMKQGRQQYLLRKWWTQPSRNRQLAIASGPPAPEGDPLQADFSQATKLDAWFTETGLASPRQLEARLMHDGRYLYAELQDKSAQNSPTDAWELVFALRRTMPTYRLRIGADGTCRASLHGATAGWESGAVAKPLPAAGNAVLRVAIPLKNVAGTGVEPGWYLFGSLARVAADGDHAVWLPTIVGAEPLEWLGRLNLLLGEGAAAAESGANAPASAAEPAKTIAEGVTLRTLDPYHLGLATDDLIQGKPFRAEPNTVYWFHRGLTRPEPCLALTDARTPQTPTEDVFIEGAPEIALTWELGQALPPGQRLKTIRLTWSLEDPFRNGIRVRFEVRDAATQTWRAATDYLAVPPVAPVDNGYQAMEVDCAGKDIAGFDAFRMVDGLGKYNPRYVELDAIAGPRDSQ